jgi:hypothetical protein
MNLTTQHIDELRQLEESLWVEATRWDREYVEKIFLPEFFEFGRSGKRISREQCVAMGPFAINAKIPLEDFVVHQIDENSVLTTYISEVGVDEVQRSYRSSIWIYTPEGWRLKFHQGTPVREGE